MSWQALDWVRRQRVGHAHSKAVLVQLANYADERGTCYPSHEYLADQVEVTERTIHECMKKLEADGYLTSERHRDEKGRLGITRYKLCLDRPASAAGEVAPPEAASADGEPQTGAGPPEAGAASTGSSRSGPPEAASGQVDTPEDNLQRNPEREGAREAEKAAAPATGLTVDEAWAAMGKVWPAFAAQSADLALRALSALTPSERKVAVERVPAFLVFHRETQGKAKLPFLHNYLGEKHRWQALPQAKAAAAAVERKVVGAFDRAWSWLLFDTVRQLGPRLLDPRSPESVQLRSRIELARRGIGWPVGAGRIEELEMAAKNFVQVAVDGAEWDAWVAAMKARGVDLPRPDKAKVFWVPTQWPPDERERDVALREASEIMGVRE